MPVDGDGQTSGRVSSGDARFSTIPSPYDHHHRYLPSDRDEKEPGVKFRCERDVLADAVGTAARAAAGRGAGHPVLAGVRLELVGDELTVTGTDMELLIQVRVTVAGADEGTCVLPARLLGDVVRAVPPGAVEVAVSGEDARLQAGRTTFSLRTMALEDFPKTPDPAPTGVTLPAADLGEALRQVVRAASADEARPVLTGVLMTAEDGGLRLVATDSYRLAVRDLPGQAVLASGQKVLVPSRALNELVRLLPATGDVTLRLGERDATFEAGTVRLTTRLIEGEFPNYRQLIPANHPNRLVVSRSGLLDAIRRVKILARDSAPVRLRMSGEQLELVAVTQDMGNADEVLDARFDGGDLTVAFNPEYLSSGVEAVGGEEVVIETLDALKPALVRPAEATGYLYLLMPVRVP
jgi:DNA polymerase-3 subunit beta